MSRSQQDQIIDDEEPETCPLCIEEFDLSDKGFYPCPCGYQICQFCHNNIKTTMNGLCPACRRPYEDGNIKWEAPSQEEVARFKENQAQQAKKKAASRQKETQKREADSQNRTKLAGIRVRRQNLVYVTGLRLNTSDPQLSEKLRGEAYFGQYGKIDKIVVNKPKDSRMLQPVGVYITYFRKEDAALCIQMVNGSQNSGVVVKADYGTTKYCSAFLRNETCTNRNCTFLHEAGEENESFTRADLSAMNAISAQAQPQTQSSSPATQHQPQPPAASQTSPSVHAAQPMERQDSKDDTASPVESSDDSALPSTAGWAVRNSASGRDSQAASLASPSPVVSNAAPMVHGNDSAIEASPETSPPVDPSTIASQAAVSAQDNQDYHTATESRRFDEVLDKVQRAINSDSFRFVFDEASVPERDREVMNNFPALFDPNGGARRYMLKKQEAERRRQENDRAVASQALSAVDMPESAEGGSLQLGGEPEDRQDMDMDRHEQHVIQPPSQDSIVSPVFGLNAAFSGAPSAGPNSRSMVPQQQQQYLLQQLKSASPNYLNRPQSGQASQAPAYLSSPQSSSAAQSHGRQASRFSFANESTASASVKPVATQKVMNQQSSMMPPQQSNSYSQQQSSNQFFSSGVQGPPPGLKATGTPPVSGGGMFGQGHGFATAPLGYGVNSTGRSANDEMMRELLRNRGGSAGSGQASDGGRREFMFPSFLQHSSQSSSPAPAPGLSSFPYGPQPGAFQDHGHGPQKQRKKGKKHRHANTSSSGGGVVDLATDPSILQARMHQAGAAGQGLYGAQGQGQGDPAVHPLSGLGVHHKPEHVSAAITPGPAVRNLSDSGRATPPVPPGFSIPDADSSSSPIKYASPRPEDLSTPIHRQTLQAKTSANQSSTYDVSKRRSENSEQEIRSPRVSKFEAARGEVPSSRREKGSVVTPANQLTKEEFPALPPAQKVREGLSTETRDQTIVEQQAKRKGGKQVSEDEVGEGEGQVGPSLINEENTIPGGSKKSSDTGKPIKLDIAAATGNTSPTAETAKLPHPDAPETSSDAVPDSSITPSSASRPGTPSTTAGTPAKRSAQPRTLRVMPTAPPEVATPSVSSTAKPQANEGKASSSSSKEPSRQTSSASLKGADATPTDTTGIGENSATSVSTSRPSSPSGKAGLDSGKAKSKNQPKKERQARAKPEPDTKEKKDGAGDTAQSSDAVTQEPITGRKKKSKKPAGNVTTGSSTPTISQPTTRPPSPKPEATEESLQEPAVPSPVEPPQSSPKPDQDTQEATEEEEEAPKQHVPTPANVISELKKSGNMTLSTIELFKATGGLNYRHDVNTNDAAALDEQVYLSQEELTKLDAGEAVRRGGEDGRSASRILITPSRRYLRGLSPEQEERYLDLERRVHATKPPLKYFHRRETPGSPTFTADELLKQLAASTARPQTTTSAAAAQQASASSSPDKPPTYGNDSLAYLDQYILPPIQPRAGGNSSRPDDAAGEGLSRAGSPPPSLHIDSPIPRTYTTGEPTYSVSGVDLHSVAPPPDEPPDAASADPSHTSSAIRQALASAMSSVVGAAALAAAAGAGGHGTAVPPGALATGLEGAWGGVSLDAVEKELTARRKECEGLEKKLAAVMKRNRKVVAGAVGGN